MSKNSDKKAQEVVDTLVEKGLISRSDANRILSTVEEVLRPKR